MAKKGNGKRQSGGLLGKLVRPWGKQRVTLTKAGKNQAPMRKGKTRKAKKSETSARPTTRRERQINELKTLAKIGKRDPERLAQMISRMLLEGMQKEAADRVKFERLIWEKAEKLAERKEEDGEDGGGKGPAQDGK